MTAPACVTTPCRRCHEPHPETRTRGYERLDANGWHPWTPPDGDIATTTTPADATTTEWRITPAMALARCPQCAGLVANQATDIATHREWHHSADREGIA